MKLSKKEKILICALGIGVLGYLYYDVIYLKQVAKIAEKSQQKIEIENKYNYAVESIENLEDKISQKIILNAKVENTASIFYPTISQEHIILELNKLLSESGLNGTYSFDEISVKEVEIIEKKEIADEKSTITSLSDKYYNLQINPEEVINEDISAESSIIPSTQSSSNSATQSTSSEKVEQLQCTLSFQGEYSALNTFLNTIQSAERKIVINNISITQKNLSEVSGSMKIEFYAVPKISDEINTYLNWEFENVYGKEVPFAAGAATGEIVSQSNAKSDFIASIKAETSVLPTVIIGKANDTVKTTYAYANSNSQEIVELILSQEGDKYYYKYKTSKDKYPQNYEGLGVEFTPISDNIIIDILSETRSSDEDKSELKLSIVNNTNKLVKVRVSGDDSTNPRVSVEGDGSKISVDKK